MSQRSELVYLRFSMHLVCGIFTIMGILSCAEESNFPQLQAITPEPGSEITANETLIIQFDRVPDTVTINGMKFETMREITVDLATLVLEPEGQARITITWTKGSQSNQVIVTYKLVSLDTLPSERENEAMEENDDEDSGY